MYDNSAICMTCRHQHLIPKQEQVSMQPWLDWKEKHKGHDTFIVPETLLSKLSDVAPGLRHNADVKPAYGTPGAYTITLASLATSSTLVAGRESNALDNTSNKYGDVMVSGKITTGTSPTANTTIEVHAVAVLENSGPTWPDVFDGTDSAETITSLNVKANIVTPIASIVVPNTSNIAYPFQPVGIRKFFGDAPPPQHVIFVTHNCVAALNATGGNHAIYYTPVYHTVI